MESKEYSQNPKRQEKKRFLGLTAFCIVVSAVLFFGMVGLFSYFSFRQGTLAGAHIDLLSAAVVLCAVLAGTGLVLALVTLLKKNHRKGFAIAGLLLSLLMLLVCVGSMYLYNYLFSDLSVDKDFQGLSGDALYITDPESDGKIRRPEGEPIPIYTPWQIKSLKLDADIEFEDLSSEHLSPEVKALLTGTRPEGSSYLMGRFNEVENFMLLGVDVVSSADTMILFSVDRVHHKLKMISIPRDSYLEIPEFGRRCKATYSHRWGGPQMTIGMLNHNFSLNIRNYITVGLDELPKIIDSLGGVDVELNQADLEALGSRTTQSLHLGINHLGGELATFYCRNRKDDEIHRTGRQRNVVNSMLLTLRTWPLSNYPAFIRDCLGLCTSSFDIDDLMKLATEVSQNDYEVEAYALIDHVDYWGGRLGEEQYFYLVYDRCRASDWIYRTIYEEMYQSGYKD